MRNALLFLFFCLGVLSYPIVYVLVSGDYPGYRIFYSLGEDSWLVDKVLDLREFLEV